MATNRSAALLGLALVMIGNSPAAEPLTGIWGAPGAMLTIDRQGARLEQDCAAGSFGPVHLGSKGRFNAKGRFDVFQPGPQRADEGASGATAQFEGVLAGDTLRLTVRPAGAKAQTFVLTRNRRVKLIRCL